MTDTWDVAVEQGDVDETIRWIDWLADRRDWDELVTLRTRCERAHERGHQLWPAAGFAAHRLALDGPAGVAAAMAQGPAPAFGFGPLWEVAASTHDWSGLRPSLDDGPVTALIAQERVLRGEDLTASEVADGPDVEIPLRLCPFEAGYGVATYRPDGVEVEAPAPIVYDRAAPVPDRAPLVDDPDVDAAWQGAVDPWLRQSEGTITSVAVRGDAAEAVGRLTDGPVRMAAISLADALVVLQWAAASGGAHGRRRGGAVGRTLAWWTVAAVAGALDDWPLDCDELAGCAAALAWYAWQPARSGSGWQLRLAVSDGRRGRSWAVDAVDAGGRS